MASRMFGPGNDDEARYKKQGFQAKLLPDVLRINPDAQKERSQGYISARSLSLTYLPVRRSSARARPILNGSERAENALKEVFPARSLGNRGNSRRFQLTDKRIPGHEWWPSQQKRPILLGPRRALYSTRMLSFKETQTYLIGMMPLQPGCL
ncbi:hypothetical protein KSC_043080 [Ktedonobacter sp. SOSP1-52]|nr:hypothetical protein KSC_043080 [Ktedonobacter sp. SOSP1-52]